MKQRSHSIGGFSLLEVVFALAIGAIGLIGMAKVFPAAGRSLGGAKRNTEATLAGQEKLEQLRTLPLADAELSPGAHQDTTSVSGSTYRRLWFVEDGKPLARMKRVRVRVFPSNRDTSNAVTLTAVLGRK